MITSSTSDGFFFRFQQKEIILIYFNLLSVCRVKVLLDKKDGQLSLINL